MSTPFRGLYYGSYKAPREILWLLGVLLLLLMMATAFMGYVLPWGQMSFWGATVITNLFSAIPIVGDTIVTYLWGGYAVGNPTLNRFYLPALPPAVHHRRRGRAARLGAARLGQNNPDGVDVTDVARDTVAFTPYETVKDGLGLSVFLILYAGSSSTCRTSSATPTTTSRPIRANAGAYRAGMVTPAVLRDLARDPQ